VSRGHLCGCSIGIGSAGTIRIVISVGVVVPLLPIMTLRRIAMLRLLSVVVLIVLAAGFVAVSAMRWITTRERTPIGIMSRRRIGLRIRLAELRLAITALLVRPSAQWRARRCERLESRSKARWIRPQRAEDVARRPSREGRLIIVLVRVVLRRIGAAISLCRL